MVDLALVYKILFGVIRIKSNKLFTLRNQPQLRGRSYTLNKPRCNSQARQRLFNIRVINLWNSLTRPIFMSTKNLEGQTSFEGSSWTTFSSIQSEWRSVCVMSVQCCQSLCVTHVRVHGDIIQQSYQSYDTAISVR